MTKINDIDHWLPWTSGDVTSHEAYLKYRYRSAKRAPEPGDVWATISGKIASIVLGTNYNATNFVVLTREWAHVERERPRPNDFIYRNFCLNRPTFCNATLKHFIVPDFVDGFRENCYVLPNKTPEGKTDTFGYEYVKMFWENKDKFLDKTQKELLIDDAIIDPVSMHTEFFKSIDSSITGRILSSSVISIQSPQL